MGPTLTRRDFKCKEKLGLTEVPKTEQRERERERATVGLGNEKEEGGRRFPPSSSSPVSIKVTAFVDSCVRKVLILYILYYRYAKEIEG